MPDLNVKKPFLKKLLLVTIKIAISAFCFFHLCEKFGHEFKSFSYSFGKINWFFFVLAIGLFALSQLISVWRWQNCCFPLNIIPSSGKATFHIDKSLSKIYFVGLFCNNFLPGSFGGDLVRAYMLKKLLPLAKWTDCAGSVFVDRVFGLVALSWIGFAAAFIINSYAHLLSPGIVNGLGFLCVFSVLGILSTSILGRILPPPSPKEPEEEEALRFFDKVKIKIAEFIDALRQIKRDKIAVFKLVVSSVIVQVLVTLCLISLAVSLGIEIRTSYIWIVNPIVTLGSLLAPSINGLGVREGIYAYLFSSLGYSGASGIVLSLGWLVVILLVSLPGALFMVKKSKKIEIDAIQSNYKLSKEPVQIN